MVIDVVTDALIIIVPINLLWRVRISLRRKLALAGIFSLTIFIMVFAIVRVVVIGSYSDQPDQTWLYMWSAIEQTVAIIVACLASFRALFTRTDQPIQPPAVEHNMNMRKRIFGSKESEQPLALRNVEGQPWTVIHTGVDQMSDNHEPKQVLDSSNDMLPSDRVHVRHDINTSSSSV